MLSRNRSLIDSLIEARPNSKSVDFLSCDRSGIGCVGSEVLDPLIIALTSIARDLGQTVPHYCNVNGGPDG